MAIKWNLYDGKNPVDQVELPKLDNQKTEFLTDEETERLMTTLETWPCEESVAFVKFAMYTGLRRGEIFRLTWDDIDFGRLRLTIRENKGKKSEVIPINDEAIDVIKPRERTCEYVFPGKDGKQRTDFKGPWLKIRKAAGLPPGWRFHGLRHNFASHLVSNGVELYTVGKLMTHKNASTTQRYAHLADERLRQVSSMAGKLLTPKGKPENGSGEAQSQSPQVHPENTH